MTRPSRASLSEERNKMPEKTSKSAKHSLSEDIRQRGWLLVHRHNLPPQMGLVPELIPKVWSTTAYEKLWHRFLRAYSVLGKVKTDLGLILIEFAEKFGIRQADDPLDSLCQFQALLLKMASQLVGEGWAIRIQTFIGSQVMKIFEHPCHNMQAIIRAIEVIPHIDGNNDIQAMFLSALET